MKGVFRAPAMGRGIGERTDGLQEFEDRAGPAMGHDQRHRVRMTRTDVSELDVEPVDLGDELRQGIQLRLGLAPVVIRSPIADERLDLVQLHALGLIGDSLPVGPTGGRDAATEVDQRLLGHVDAEGTDGAAVGRGGEMRGKQTESARGRDRQGRRAEKAPTIGIVWLGPLDRIHLNLFSVVGNARNERAVVNADWPHRQVQVFHERPSTMTSPEAPRYRLHRIRSIRVRFNMND